jgi:hypothetical protein
VRAELGRLSHPLGADSDLNASQSNLRHSTRFIESGGNPIWVRRPKLWISRVVVVDSLLKVGAS